MFSSRRYFTYYVASKVGLTVSSELELQKKGRLYRKWRNKRNLKLEKVN